MDDKVMVIAVNWECLACQVLGRSLEGAEACWFCGGPVNVTAKPTVWVDALGTGGSIPVPTA